MVNKFVVEYRIDDRATDYAGQFRDAALRKGFDELTPTLTNGETHTIRFHETVRRDYINLQTVHTCVFELGRVELRMLPHENLKETIWQRIARIFRRR